MDKPFHEYSLAELPKRIGKNDRVLDVGGWHAPLNRANAVIDIMPYESRSQAGAVLKEVWADEHFTKDTFIQQDICSGKPWPFADQSFDFVYCSNTLEDVRDPLRVCAEILRVGKSGLIEVPSRIAESTKGVERPFYCGYYHHRWLCETEGTDIQFLFKPAMLHAYRGFQLRKPMLKKLNGRYGSVGFFWENSFTYSEKVIIDRSEVQENLRAFKKACQELSDLFIPKYNWLGQRT